MEMEKSCNKYGRFLRISKCLHETVSSVVIPQGQGGQGWRKLEESLEVILVGDRFTKERSVQRGEEQNLPYDRTRITGKSYKEAVQDKGTVGQKVEKKKADFSSQHNSTQTENWSWVVACERQVVHQTWKDIEEALGKWLQFKVELFPYQNNRAFFACNSKEEATRIGGARKLKMDGQPEVLLWCWEQSLKNNITKVVSYGGWIAVTGLPIHWWSKKYFERIGDACGGLLEVGWRTEKLKYLIDAKLKVRKNTVGFLPELLKLAEGNEVYYV